MAFEIVAGLCVTYLGCAGIVGYYSLLGVEDIVKLDQNKFYARSTFVENHLIYPMISYQGWNFLLCVLSFSKSITGGTDLWDPAMIGHHFVTGSLAYFGLAPYLHFYGLFYFGIAELTNIPLTVMDVFKYFKDMATANPTLNSITRTTFAISFIILRLVIWPIYSYPFWVGSLKLIGYGESEDGKIHSYFVVGFFLFANIFLTSLQFFWGSKIFSSILFKPKKETNSKVK